MSADMGVKVEMYGMSLPKRVGGSNWECWRQRLQMRLAVSVSLVRPICCVLGRVAVNDIIKIRCLRVDYRRGVVA